MQGTASTGKQNHGRPGTHIPGKLRESEGENVSLQGLLLIGGSGSNPSDQRFHHRYQSGYTLRCQSIKINRSFTTIVRIFRQPIPSIGLFTSLHPFIIGTREPVSATRLKTARPGLTHSDRAPLAMPSSYFFVTTNTLKLPGTTDGRGRGFSAVAAGFGPNSAATTYALPVTSSNVIVRPDFCVATV